MRNAYFARLSDDQRTERFERIIRTRTNDLLSSEEIQRITGAVDKNRQYGIEVAFQPDDFERLLTLRKIGRQKSDGRLESSVMDGTGIFGSFAFGEEIKTVDEKRSRAVGKYIRAKLYQPAMPAAAIITVTNSGYADLITPLSEEKIVIYIPLPLIREAG